MLKINNKIYAIDLDKLMEWVSSSPSTERNVGTTITQVYPIMDDEAELSEDTLINYSTREITENKESLNDTMNNIRYDIVKIIIGILLGGENCYNDFESSLSHQQKICFNTLLKHEIINEITDNNC